MNNLLIKTYNAHQKRIKCFNETPNRLKRFINCVPILFQEILFSLAYLPHFLKNMPYSGFSNLAGRNEKGEFIVSYSRYLTYKKYALSFLTVFLTLLGLGTSLFVFTIYPQQTQAAGACVEPFTATISLPATNLTICKGDSFTFSGYWSDSVVSPNCTDTNSYYGVVNGSIISTSTAIKVSSGIYFGTGVEKTTYSKTVYGNTVGTHAIAFGVASPIEIEYFSDLKSITVKDTPDVTGNTLNISTHNETAITWSWTDVTATYADEDNYAIYDEAANNKSGSLAADTISWPETSLSANTQYSRKLYASNTCGTGTYSNLISAYTSIQAPAGLSFDSVAKDSITISGTGTIANLAAGSSGIIFNESVTATNSGWLQANSWPKTGLAANTQYSFTGQTRNGDGDTTTATAAQTKYTLAADANVTADKTASNWYSTADTTFTNAVGFGAAGVQYYRYVWDKNAAYSFNDTETQWSSSTKTLTATSEGQWYLHVKAYNNENVAASSGATQDLGPYGYDSAGPTITNNQAGDDTWRNSAGTTYNVDFTSDGNSDLDYAQYAIGSSLGATNLKAWTNIFTDDAASYTTDWTVDFNSLQEGTNYVSFRVYDKAGNVTTETDPGFYIKKDITEPAITNNVSGDDTWRNASGTTYDVDFLSNGGSLLDYAQYAVGTSQGASDIKAWTNIFTDDAANYTTAWPVDFASLQEGANYVSFRAYDKAGNATTVTDLGFHVNKDTVPANTVSIDTAATTESAVITWTTDEATTTQVAWGITGSYGNLTAEGTSLTTSHSATVGGLSDNTVYHFKPLGDDKAGNLTAAADHVFTTSQVEATVITNVSVTEISTTSVKVTWTTNHAADSKVRYGATTAYGSEVYSSSLVASHSLTLTGLTAGTTYHYEVLSTGNTTTYDADATFTTSQPATEEEEEEETPPPETLYLASPTVVSPTDGATITVAKPTITGLARSNNTIFIFIDSEMIGTVLSTNHISGTGSFAYQLKTNLTEGTHTVYTIARNSSGVYSERSPKITFTVNLPYVTPTLFEPIFTDGDNPTVIIRGVAFNDSLIKVYVDGEYVGEFSVTNSEKNNTASFAYTLPLSNLSVGQHSITAKAFSSSGEASNISNAVSFTKTSVLAELSQPSYQFTSGVDYTVVAGDSLWKIAERFYGRGSDYNKIVEANQTTYPSLASNPSLILPGWNLNIP